MSWDVLVARFPPIARSAEDLDAEWEPVELTTPRAMIEACRAIDHKTSVAANGTVDFGPYQIYFDDLDTPIGMIALSGYGDLAGGVELLSALVRRLEARALDPQTGEFLDASDAQASMDSWKSCRDRVVGSGAPLTSDT